VVHPRSQEHSIPTNGSFYCYLSATYFGFFAIDSSPSYFLAQFYHGYRELGLLIALALVIFSDWRIFFDISSEVQAEE
jgi:hypothetical protein